MAIYLTEIPKTNRSPILDPIPDQKVRNEHRWSFQLKATDPDGDPLSFSLRESPWGMAVNPKSGRMTWEVPGDKRTYSVLVRVTDSEGAFAERRFRIRVD